MCIISSACVRACVRACVHAELLFGPFLVYPPQPHLSIPSRASLYSSISHVWHSMPVQRNHLEREHRKRACPQ